MSALLRAVLAVLVVSVALTLSLSGVPRSAWTQTPPKAPPPPPPLRAIPGLTAEDPHPHACVDCHVNMKEFGMDERLSTLMAQWNQGVEPKLLAIARATAVDSSKITGKHPKVGAALRDIPKGCVVCHGKSSKLAPPFARMIHRIHLVGGEANQFVSYFQGDCTHCHKLDQKTGAWSIPSAPEP